MPKSDDQLIDQITEAALPMSEGNQDADSGAHPLSNRPLTGRRKPAVDWQRINGPAVVQRPGALKWTALVLGRSLKWMALLIFTPLACYVAAGVVGALLPVNSDFQNASDGIEIFIYSGNVHSELILPLRRSEQDWTETFPAVSSLPAQPTSTGTDGLSHIAIGWGDRNFYTQTEQWSELTLATAANAFFAPTESVLHVQPVAAPYVSSRSMRVKISAEQYAALCQSIQSAIADTQPIPDASFGDQDHFFSATGKFHLFNTCNNWVGERMKAAGIKVGRFTPLPKTVFWHLEN